MTKVTFLSIQDGNYYAYVAYLSALNINEELWFLGGIVNSSYVKTSWRLIPNSKEECVSIFQADCRPKWKKLPDLLIPRSGIQAAYYNNEIMFIGAAMSRFDTDFKILQYNFRKLAVIFVQE